MPTLRSVARKGITAATRCRRGTGKHIARLRRTKGYGVTSRVAIQALGANALYDLEPQKGAIGPSFSKMPFVSPVWFLDRQDGIPLSERVTNISALRRCFLLYISVWGLMKYKLVYSKRIDYVRKIPIMHGAPRVMSKWRLKIVYIKDINLYDAKGRYITLYNIIYT